MIHFIVGTAMVRRGMRLSSPFDRAIVTGAGALMTIHGLDWMRERVTNYLPR